MAYRMESIEVPVDDPFKNDSFNRREVVEFLSSLIGRAGGPFVLALDSPWGTGKSVFVKMLEADLQAKNFQCVYFDAWKSDHVMDPLVALVASVEAAIKNASKKKNFPALESVKKITGIVAKRGAVAAIKAFSFGALDLEEEVENAVAEFGAETFTDLVEVYKAETALFDRFRKKLEETVGALEVDGKEPTLVFFIDELDRCRPSFAIQLLERIKHLFDLANICFVLSVNKGQLESVVRAVYGSNINAQEYLRRFFDLEYGLPAGKSVDFTAALLKRFDVDSYFIDENGSGAFHLVEDRQLFIDSFTALSDVFELTLRARERCITRFKIVLDQTPNNNKLYPQLVALLVVVRATDPLLFERIANGRITPFEVMDYMGQKRYGAGFVDSDEGRILLGLLIAYFPLSKKYKEFHDQAIYFSEHTSGMEQEGWLLVVRVLTNEKRNNSARSFQELARKIDISSGVKL